MSKLNQYSVQFVRRKPPNGEVVLNAIIENVNGNSVLNFINGLDEHDTVSFINDLNDCININGNRDEGFFSDSVEHISILYQYPNVNIDDILVLPMVDLKEILEEWLEFISST